MRTFWLFCLVALIGGIVAAFALGYVGATTDHSDGKYFVTFTLNADKICPNSTTTSSPDVGAAENGHLVDLKGKIAAIRSEKNELIVSANLKNWTFELANDTKLFVNDSACKLSDLQVGDEAAVTFTRQGEKMVASAVRCTRN